jgi:hypothetical protein
MEISGTRYDPDLQMFADPPRDPGQAHLGFLRWLAERGRLEHETVGAPGGEYASDELDERATAA